MGKRDHCLLPTRAPQLLLPWPWCPFCGLAQVGKAVKAAANFLDSTASTTSYVLRQYPLARLGVFAYVVLIHLYVYLLIARMQRIATHWEASITAAPLDG